jgi:S1-C subfamily serine protease
MMTEGQGSGNDSPERDSAWQSAPSAEGTPAAPDADTDPGAADAAPPGAPWFPFATTPPASAAEQPPADAPQAPGSQPVPGTPQAPSAHPASGPQPVPGAPQAPTAQQAPGPQPVPGLPQAPSAQQAPGSPQAPGPQPVPGGQPAPGAQPAPASPWQAQPGTQPTWAAPGTPQPPWAPPGTQPQPGQGTPPQHDTPPYGAQQGAQPGYGTPPPPGYGGQPPYGGQPTYPTQPLYGGQPPYGEQPPYGGQSPYGEQPQGTWQLHPGEPGPVPPLPAQVPGAAPPGGGGQWVPPGGYGQPTGRPSRGPLSYVLVYVLVAVLAAAIGAGAVLALRGSSGPAPTSSTADHGVIPKPKTAPGSSTSGINVNAVARKVEPGLVDIISYVHYQREVFEGTGMVLSSDGLVLTNNHVIKGSTRVVVQLVSNDHKYQAQVVGTDNSHDVALLRLTGASGLKTVQIGDSNKVQLGDQVVALGNAGGNGGAPTVTSGTITALKRSITASDAGSGTSEQLTGMFQTNAPIAEGDSGGALANAAGQVIAMNTAANSQSIGGNGTSRGFSIPIDRALLIARQIAAGHATGTIQIGQPAFIGIAIASDPKSNAPSSASNPRTQLGQLRQLAQGNFGSINSSGKCLANDTTNPVPNSVAPAKSGALIAGVFCNAPAAAAGAAAGDVITAVNGHAVTSPAALRILMRQYHPGTTVSLTWVGLNGHQQTGSVKLANGPAA